ncbi:acyltransferase family protein [Gilvimarinus sp. DA14]|uniref:acyltransferase family protein n=1 Tax=Gilvimarinus sp. DA14 TaxID=2956798 RepID=UPI0020B810E5|nr:acyltransferase family protein [Gilvimarinus sp. DA14]UTF59935.1 acyltransferase family protein [Gilvimarinus sp. DA14]
MNTVPSNNTRLDYLDAVRAFALLLGIVFHASLSFLPVYIGWAVMDISTSEVVGVFALISHSFRMELFFLVAGFFSHMSYHRKGAANFLKSRVLRIAVPFVVGWILLRPLLVSGWIMGMQSLRGEVSIWPALGEGFASLLGDYQAPFTGTHLWFLYYLLIITVGLLCCRTLVTRHEPLYRMCVARVDAVLMRWCRSPMAIFAVAIPTTGCLWFMGQWGMDTPDKSLAPHWPVAIIYGACFTSGWLMHRQVDALHRFSQLRWYKALMAVIAIIAAVVLSPYESQSGHPQATVLKLAFQFSYAVMMWSLVAITIGIFRRFLDRPNKTVRYLADASYWLYLLHLPLVIWLQIAFAEVALHWSVKLALITGITLGLSLLAYDLLVRSTWLGRVLNGQRKPRLLSAARFNRPALH